MHAHFTRKISTVGHSNKNHKNLCASHLVINWASIHDIIITSHKRAVGFSNTPNSQQFRDISANSQYIKQHTTTQKFQDTHTELYYHHSINKLYRRAKQYVPHFNCDISMVQPSSKCFFMAPVIDLLLFRGCMSMITFQCGARGTGQTDGPQHCLMLPTTSRRNNNPSSIYLFYGSKM